MIGKIADAVNRMFTAEKVQDQNGNQVTRNDQINIANFNKDILKQNERVREITDTYEGRRVGDDQNSKKKEQQNKKKSDKEQDDETQEKVIHIDERV